VTVFVIDASVAIKWVIDEPGTRQALDLLRHTLFAPDLLMAECANILRKKAAPTNTMDGASDRAVACEILRGQHELSSGRTPRY
jgi:predicted nucleic acid-binding protein